jgi:hypothetical protein
MSYEGRLKKLELLCRELIKPQKEIRFTLDENEVTQDEHIIWVLFTG